MSDVRCVQCGEPWEYYYVMHEMTEAEKKSILSGSGCPACKDRVVDKGKQAVIQEVMSFLGDDTDAFAAMDEDGDLDFLYE